ncbi:MAG: prepilin peptidase [Rhodoferax sp.]|nr:prepilin peptidase [Pseudorhodobacter sp.]
MTLTQALWFLPFALPIAIWVSWSDMKFMKIPNKSVIALAAVWLIVGFFVMERPDWLWGFAFLAIALVIGFGANMISLIGAGDAKFAAAMAPFFVVADWRYALGLFTACLLAAFVIHRVTRRIPALKSLTTTWVSWTNKDFPMGLALSGTLIFYLATPLWMYVRAS